jgi:hypothetical protein
MYHRTSLIQELPVPESLPSPSLSVSISANNRHRISYSYLTTSNWIVTVCTSQSSPPLRPCLTPNFRQGWGCECTSRLAPTDLGFAYPRIISTNPVSRGALCFAINSNTPRTRAAIPPRLPFLHQNVNFLANMHCTTSPSLILRLVVLMHASLKIAQPLEYFIRGTSWVSTFTRLYRPLREIPTQNCILCV